MTTQSHIHQGQPLSYAGTPLNQAAAAVIMLHQRGGQAEHILSLVEAFKTEDIAYVAPQAAGFTWYPQRFIAPLEANEPYLSSALAAVDETVTEVEAAGIPTERIMLLGFSQGACLALEYVARNAKRYAGAVGFSGGLIGPKGTIWDFPGNLEGTPVFIGCSDVDFHIPLERVHETTAALTALGAVVEERIYPGMEHTINADEIAYVQQMLEGLKS